MKNKQLDINSIIKKECELKLNRNLRDEELEFIDWLSHKYQESKS